MDHILCILLIIFCYLPLQSLVESKPKGFTIDIIHRDSPLSPFYNHSATPGDLSRNDALRSIARANSFRPSSLDSNEIESITIPQGGNYLMKLSIGSPPVEVLAFADTGSDLVWIQCQPCEHCYPQDTDVFNPMQSSTYMELPCDSNSCQHLPRRQCGNTKNECSYLYTYGDRSYTSGTLASDTFTFDSTDDQVAAFPNSVFGCGHNNEGTFTSGGSGLIGLGGGPLSLISQLGSQIDQKFSYCLLPRSEKSSSKLRFGADAVISGAGVVSTPLLSEDSGTFYYLILEGISVGNKKVLNSQPTTANKGNIVIDSGTTLTILESGFYNDLEAAVKEAIGLNPVQDPQGQFSLCYDKSSSSSVSQMTMVFHFRGADVTLKPLNILVETNSLICLAMVPSDEFSLYGNVAQMNFQVEYDLAGKQVSFAPADCTKY